MAELDFPVQNIPVHNLPVDNTNQVVCLTEEQDLVQSFDAQFGQTGAETCDDGFWRCQSIQWKKQDMDTEEIFRCQYDGTWTLDERMNSKTICTPEMQEHIHDHYDELQMDCIDDGFGHVLVCNVGQIRREYFPDFFGQDQYQYLYFRCTGVTETWIKHEQSDFCDTVGDKRNSPDGFPQVCVHEHLSGLDLQTWQCDAGYGRQQDAQGIEYICTSRGLWEIDNMHQNFASCDEHADEPGIHMTYNDVGLPITCNTEEDGDGLWKCSDTQLHARVAPGDDRYYRCIAPGIWHLDY